MRMDQAKTTSARNRKEWRSWLRRNHKSGESVWLIYYKKHSGKESIPYADAVEEAICFGWIDGQVKKIDEDRYMQRYSPRTSKSRWSEINVKRANKMIRNGEMTELGLKVFREGIKNNRRVPSSKNFSVPTFFREALSKNKIAWGNFRNLPPSAKLAYVYWVSTAKKEETRQRRIKRSIQLLVKNKKLGLV